MSVLRSIMPILSSSFFFFSSRRRHTRSLCDWSSDVCSSDLEAGPWVSTTVQRGPALVRARLAARGGLVYSNPGPGYASSSRYDVEGFGRFTGEASVRAPFPFGTTFGVRLFGGAYAGRSAPVPQRRIPIAGADPYETFTNPLLRSAGALFVRPDFYYHAPGNGNLRGFRNDLGGRWA